MALKRKVSKAEYEKLSDEIKGFYKENGDEYTLQIDGDEDTGALKRAKDREAQLRKEAEAKNKELEERLAALEGDDARKRGDIATLEKSWQSKLEGQKKDYEAKIEKLTTHIKTSLVDNVAKDIAHKISTAPSLLLPHIKARLVADFDGDTPVTRILDKDGKVSALSLDELQQEFVANKEFSAIIRGSKASGGAGQNAFHKNGGGAPTNPDGKTADLSKMNPAQLAAHLKESKAQTQDA